MEYKTTHKFDFDEEKYLMQFLEENNMVIDHINSSINVKIVRNRKTNEYEGSIKVIENEDDYDSSEFQWWEAVPNQYIKIKGASELTGLSVNYLRNLVQRGEIPHYRQGKFIVFKPEELKNWIENRTTKPEVKK